MSGWTNCLEGAGAIEWLSEAEIAQRRRGVRLDPAAVRRPDGAGYFSPPGAQPKMALFRDGDRGAFPRGACRPA